MIPSLIQFFSKRTTFLKLAIETSRDVTARFRYYHRQKGMGMARMHDVVASWEHFPHYWPYAVGFDVFCLFVYFFCCKAEETFEQML